MNSDSNQAKQPSKQYPIQPSSQYPIQPSDDIQPTQLPHLQQFLPSHDQKQSIDQNNQPIQVQDHKQQEDPQGEENIKQQTNKESSQFTRHLEQKEEDQQKNENQIEDHEQVQEVQKVVQVQKIQKVKQVPKIQQIEQVEEVNGGKQGTGYPEQREKSDMFEIENETCQEKDEFIEWNHQQNVQVHENSQAGLENLKETQNEQKSENYQYQHNFDAFQKDFKSDQINPDQQLTHPNYPIGQHQYNPVIDPKQALSHQKKQAENSNNERESEAEYIEKSITLKEDKQFEKQSLMEINRGEREDKKKGEKYEENEKKRETKEIDSEKKGIKIDRDQSSKKQELTEAHPIEKKQKKTKQKKDKKDKKNKNPKQQLQPKDTQQKPNSKSQQNPIHISSTQNNPKHNLQSSHINRDQQKKSGGPNPDHPKKNFPKENMSPNQEVTKEIKQIGQTSKIEEEMITATMIIKEAQKQRIGSTLSLFLLYQQKHEKHTNSQKSIIESVYNEIDRRKKQKYVFYHFLKEYFKAYSSFAKDFHEKSYKVSKIEVNPERNTMINLEEELQPGIQELIYLRKQTGNQYKRLEEFIQNKTYKQLENVFNKFIFELNTVQTKFNQKKKMMLESEEKYNKFSSKLQKFYLRGKQGKKQDEDVFVETCRFIDLERKYRNSLVLLGKQLFQIRKVLINEEQNLSNQLQNVLNNFKNHVNTVYNLHKKKFDKILPSMDQIKSQTKFNKICSLADLDYIKYALELSDKKDLAKISDRDFQYFVQMPHFETATGNSSDLLKGMFNKSFNLKKKDEELINTISGNLVIFNRQKVEYVDKFCVKNIQAQIIAEGLVQVDQLIPGIIFDSQRTVRIEFRDEDRAEELICLLNEKFSA